MYEVGIEGGLPKTMLKVLSELSSLFVNIAKGKAHTCPVLNMSTMSACEPHIHAYQVDCFSLLSGAQLEERLLQLGHGSPTFRKQHHYLASTEFVVKGIALKIN
jgi:hypothetical protein